MAKLEWDAIGERNYEDGLDRGVLYVGQKAGVPWNGLTSITESVDGGDPTSFYLDGVNYLNKLGSMNFKATLSALYSPPEFDVCDGNYSISDGFIATLQKRQTFGLSYRTKVGSDALGLDYGYKIHLIYNLLASPSDKQRQTVSDSTTVDALSWDLTAYPVLVPGAAPSAHFIIDSTKLYSWVLPALEAVLYGDDDNDGRLPDPTEIQQIISEQANFVLNLFPQGKFTIDAPDSAVISNSDGQWELQWDAAEYINSDEYWLNAPIANSGTRYLVRKNLWPHPYWGAGDAATTSTGATNWYAQVTSGATYTFGPGAEYGGRTSTRLTNTGASNLKLGIENRYASGNNPNLPAGTTFWLYADIFVSANAVLPTNGLLSLTFVDDVNSDTACVTLDADTTTRNLAIVAGQVNHIFVKATVNAGRTLSTVRFNVTAPGGDFQPNGAYIELVNILMSEWNTGEGIPPWYFDGDYDSSIYENVWEGVEDLSISDQYWTVPS